MALRRGVVFVLSLITLAVIVSFTGIVFVYLLVSRGPSIEDDSTLVLRPGGQLQETLPDDVVGQLIGRNDTTVRGFVESLRLAKRDPRITGVLLMPSSLESPFWAKVQELRDAVLDFRKSGKIVVAFLEYGGDREYYLASAADRVFLLPTSALDLTGVASYEVFLRGTLDKVGGVSGLPADRRVQDRRQPAHREGLHARAPRDDRVAQQRHVRAARARHRRRPQEDRGRGAPAARSGAVRAGGRACARVSSTRSPTKISSTIACRSCGRAARCAASRGMTISA